MKETHGTRREWNDGVKCPFDFLQYFSPFLLLVEPQKMYKKSPKSRKMVLKGLLLSWSLVSLKFKKCLLETKGNWKEKLFISTPMLTLFYLFLLHEFSMNPKHAFSIFYRRIHKNSSFKLFHFDSEI